MSSTARQRGADHTPDKEFTAVLGKAAGTPQWVLIVEYLDGALHTMVGKVHASYGHVTMLRDGNGRLSIVQTSNIMHVSTLNADEAAAKLAELKRGNEGDRFDDQW